MTTKNIALIAGFTIGTIFTIAGYFGPEDEGLLMTIGLVMLAISFMVAID